MVFSLLSGCVQRTYVVVYGEWEQLEGMDGGDMHFIFSTSKGVMFVSHGFGGVWRSGDGGKSWKIINQEDFVDVHFL